MVFLLFLLSANGYASGLPPEKDFSYYMNSFVENYYHGDFVKCEEAMLSASALDLPEYYKASIYNNLGVTYYLLGNYEDALKAYSRIETMNLTPDEINSLTPPGLVNRALIYGKRKMYDKAVSYYERAIRILEQTAKSDASLFERLALAYHNMGTVYSERGEFRTALVHFNASLSIMEKHKIQNKSLPLSTIAKCYAKLNDRPLAEAYFKRCLSTATIEHGTGYYNLYEFHVLYADFLSSEKKYAEALAIYRRVMLHFLETYGSKNANTSGGFRNLGELKLKTGEYDSSLYFYQRSLISIVGNFNDENIETNPGIDSSFLNVRLLENLKGKSKVLEALAATRRSPDERIRTLKMSLSTLELAMDLTDIMRNNFPTEESKMYISEIEKETYISGIRIASVLYTLTGSDSLLSRMYGFVQRSKAAVLRDEIISNKLVYSATLPDSVIEKEHRLASNIAGYRMLIYNEENSERPDKSRINLWKDEAFEMSRQKEILDRVITDAIPGYPDLPAKTTPLPLKEIMGNLERDEIIIDYSVSGSYNDGKRDLFIFLIDRRHLKFYRSETDSLFIKNALVLRNTSDPSIRSGRKESGSYLSALFYMYNTLIQPVGKELKNKRLIIIPDEEISWLPFEAFLTKEPESNSVDFDGLHFLIYDHSISHAYSSSLIPVPSRAQKEPVYAFSPFYESQQHSPLRGSIKEIESVNSIMGGKVFTGAAASRNKFINYMKESVIFHLAMHSLYDSTNSLYSYLLFDSNGSDSSKLYNYEISLGRISTPMIVLSSCNSGAGTLNRSEGLMSIARSFILAGASSVVRTAWEVNDDSGSEIVTRFYYYLSRGYSKDRALRLAKIDFIEKAPPSFRDPYYWAAYEVLGDNSPVRHGKGKIVTFVTIPLLLMIAGVYLYLRRRRISAARLL